MKQSYLVASNRALTAEGEDTCRNDAIDPGSSRDRWSTWIQMHGKQKPSSPKPREKDDILQLASITAKCTNETECKFKANCCLKLPLAESCLWRVKKSVGTKIAFPVSRTNAEFPVGWSNWEFWSGNQCKVSCRRNLCWGLGYFPAKKLLARNAVVACRDAGFPKRYQRGSLVVVWALI